MGHDHDDLVARLQSKIQAMMDKPPLAQPKRKQFINLAFTKQKERERQKSREKEKQKQSLSDKYLKQMKILENKLSFSELRYEEKRKVVETLETELNNVNSNKMNLIN